MSSLSLSQPQASSSSSSTSSLVTAAPQRRIKLTIKPLKLKASASTLISPLSQDAAPSDDKKVLPKIKIKPRRPSVVNVVDNDTMNVDSPMRPPSLPPTRAVSAQPVELLPPPPPPPNPPPNPPPAYPLPPQKVKVPRPIKLKPLKEVLSRLITLIKRKDDYAFFLQPVDQLQVPGYSNVVKIPMDFGTMTEKVERGRYRSLEQFKDDFCLVTSNAKTFNPPSTLYHIEASKIEAYGLEQIARAATHVIEYETDWTIDVVADDDSKPFSADFNGSTEDGAIAVPFTEDEVGRSGPSRARSPSVLSSAAGIGNMPMERARRNARSKKIPVVTESWEEGGHLPGYKDGIGVFPAGSDLASLILQLKLRGKRFRTKKERLKREKEGPPLTADGSLDYNEMENPYTVLRNLAPDPLFVPYLTPLMSTPSAPLDSREDAPEASQPPEDRKEHQADKSVRGPIAIPPDVLPTILADNSKHTYTNPVTSTSQIGNKRLHHWTITRNPPRSARVRDEDEDVACSSHAKRRRVEAPDYGAFATLVGTLAAENGLKADDFNEVFTSDEKLLEQIRLSIESRKPPLQPPKTILADRDTVLDADEYIRDVVYGGIDGLAYFRSLAEFVGEYHGPLEREADLSVSLSSGKLGMPLAQWVEMHIVDPLTHGNHSVLRAISHALARPNSNALSSMPELACCLESVLSVKDKAKMDARESVRDKLQELLQLTDPAAQIDISTLLRAPEELFLAESAWAGREPRTQDLNSNIALVGTSSGQDASIAGAGLGTAGAISEGITFGGSVAAAVASESAIERALAVGAESLRELGRRVPGQEQDKDVGASSDARIGDGLEDALERRTRLNLIALAKRAPIDRIARLPPELVPLHIRHIVPTLGS